MLLQAWGVASMTFSVTPYGAAFGGALIEQSRPDSTSNTYLLGLVPSGYSYLLVVNSGHTLSGWTEYR